MGLFPDSAVTIDAVRFADLAQAALAGADAAEAAKAADAFTGPLLPEDLYEPWVQEHRNRLHLLHVRLLRQAKRWALLAELDPTDEEAQLALMRQYAARR